MYPLRNYTIRKEIKNTENFVSVQEMIIQENKSLIDKVKAANTRCRDKNAAEDGAVTRQNKIRNECIRGRVGVILLNR